MKKFTLIPLLLGLLYSGSALAEFEVYGFAMLDYVQDFKRVHPAWKDALRPTRIPTRDGQYGSDGQAILSVRQSRLGVNADVPTAGMPLKTKFEFDMFGVGGDEGQTTIRLRHAYGEWGPWLAGQTHSLFMDIDAFPNTLEYWGPSGMVFFRNPQLRYTPVNSDINFFALAIENPTADLDPSLGAVSADNKVPDFTAQYKRKGDWGHMQLSGILRQVGYDTPGNTGASPDASRTGWGVNASTNFKLRGTHKLILAAVYGHGVASYMNDAAIDMASDSQTSVDPKLLPLLGVVAYYDHYWNKKWSTSIGYSRTDMENTGGQAAGAFDYGQYASINLLHTPQKNILGGAEFLYGKRHDKNGAQGEDYRVQISMKYSFSGIL